MPLDPPGAFAGVNPLLVNWLNGITDLLEGRMTDQAVIIGNATGGGQGAGTINAVNLFVNGVAVVAGNPTYDFSVSGNPVLAADRPLDSWTVTARAGGAASVTKAAPGAGLQLVVSAWGFTVMTNGVAGNGTIKLKSGSMEIDQDGGSPNAVLNYIDRYVATGLRLLCPANTAVSATAPAFDASTDTSLFIAGFTISTPNS